MLVSGLKCSRYCNRHLGSILKKVSVIRHQVLRSMRLVFGASLDHVAARERYFKSWQGHVATSKTTPFECEPSPPMWGKSGKGQEIRAVLWGDKPH